MRKQSSTNFENQQLLHGLCDGALTLSLLSGRWKITILGHILQGVTRFSALKTAIPGITDRILALQLQELVADGIIEKTGPQAENNVPGYTLSGLGVSLQPVIEALAAWGKQNREQILHTD
ncbi:winged helix-turn-helix transcriptional regulator [Chitinophaga nivalis]|uniref:Helix-turn-helix transcriptional regulator n=1 Tax=Chitinophaga nivalis TaxID=2991709 RepID=A0ABT3IPA6_9BACT|nr:helix-turn-helix domain-containing protein [Chitinophaga nivalis]MCW3464507.1 helix-turn-helix transcriptional regulator [Chitinophaga nivalis]MCW3485802.1 helix-turn-helix transcriptional regulator [Chitinophaga nivalis]